MIEYENSKKRYKIEVSERSLKLLKSMQDSAQSSTGIRMSYDKIITLAFEKPTIIVIKDEKERVKAKKVRSVFDEPIGDVGMLNGWR